MSPHDYARLLESFLEQAAAYARSILRDRHDAEDALQQAALRGLERLGAYDVARSFKGWWFVVLRNCCLDIVRSRKARQTLIEGAARPSAASPVGEEWAELASAMARLAPEHAEILRLRYFGNLSYHELSQALAVPEGTVMSRLHYARKALAAEMKGVEK